ncbi:MAG: MoaD/ThiS family protein [Rhodobacterales bacterium]|jgi:sulfur-carrier protein|nr:MoaD/ThiS family protein [Pseudomonadota bacterium]MDA1286107.1 MoaD/ThiS family protein [Pseudomonadota bacterium]NQW13069.1 MoaD/ThiS family protein [Rhodobacter sp.]
MVTVTIWGSLRDATDGAAEVEVNASTFIEVLNALKANYPGLTAQIDRGVSMSIDGLIYKDSWFTPVRPDSEVVLMPLMVGG